MSEGLESRSEQVQSEKKKKKKNDRPCCCCRRAEQKTSGLGTRDSQPVTHASTNRARRCLTAQIGRDGVCSAWCGPSPSRPRESANKSGFSQLRHLYVVLFTTVANFARSGDRSLRVSGARHYRHRGQENFGGHCIIRCPGEYIRSDSMGYAQRGVLRVSDPALQTSGPRKLWRALHHQMPGRAH